MKKVFNFGSGNKFDFSEKFKISTKTRFVITVLLLLLIVGFDWYYAMSYNIQKFSSVVIVTCIVLLLCLIWLKTKLKFWLVLVGSGFIALSFLLSVFSSPIFHADTYSNLIGNIEVIGFEDFFSEKNVNFSLVDKYSAMSAATTKIGELSDVSSMFDLDSDEFSQINYKGEMVRIAQIGRAHV